MARVAERSGLSSGDFLAWEREQSERHEYFRGQVFAMAGGSPRHNALCVRTGAALLAAVGHRGCSVFSSDQRIGVGVGERYVYPDISAVCGQVALEQGTRDVINNPTILIEVLSSSTEQYDRGLKWEGYQRMPSLDDYVLVSQLEARIEHFRRDAAGAWFYRAATAGERITLTNGAVLDVDSIFAGVFELPGD
jgi:Uma2 family endonuclease